MRVLDLFAGLKGWSAAFAEHGHEVFSTDIDPAFDVSLHKDILELRREDLPWTPDIVLASPPCEHLSTLTFQHGYFQVDGEGVPRPVKEQGFHAIKLVRRTWQIIEALDPSYYVVENPRALLRQVMEQTSPAKHVRHTVWYCHYGRPVAKPTDLWGRFPKTWVPEPECHNRRDGHPEDCCCRDHNPAPRGSRSGTQGPQTAAERGEIPYDLSRSMCMAAEAVLGEVKETVHG